jgi:outer membrane receptor for ferrienterochelin and colicin
MLLYYICSNLIQKHIIMNKLLLFLTLLPLVAISQNSATISGYVKGKAEQPLEGVSIIIEGTQLGTITDNAGFFRITNVLPSNYNLTASFLGYETQTLFNAVIKTVGNQEYNFVLVQNEQLLNEVTIKKSKLKRTKETPLSIQSLSAVEIANYPGSNNDVVRVAQSLPGVSPSVGGFRNDLIIRGGASNETVYYLDGMEIPNINHFSTQGSSGGPVGLLNVSFIEDVTLSASAFGAKYDNPLSGVLQFKQRKGNDERFSSNFRLSATEAAFTTEGPLFKNGKEKSNTSFIASVRRSYLQFLFEAIGLPIRPNYWDYQYKVTHKIDEYNELNLTGIGSIDEFSLEAPDDFDANQQALLDQAPFIEQQTNAVGMTWRKRFKNNKGFMSTTLSNNILKNVFTRFEDNKNKTGELFKNDAIENETKLRYEITYFLNDWKINAGANQQYSYYSNTTFGVNPSINYATEIDFIKYGFFGNLSNSFLDNKLDVSFGFRVDDDTFLNTNLLETFSPRLAVSYKLQDTWRISGTLGRYFKIPPYTILGFRNNSGALINQNSNYTISNHAVLGIEKTVGDGAKVSLEAFYKQYEDYPVSINDGVSLANKGAGFEVLGNEPIATVGKGRAYGFEFLAQQKFINNFYGIFSYTFFYSEFTGLDNVYRPSVWDSRHLISLTSGYKLKKNWEVAARYRFVGNTPYAPVNQAETLANYPQVVFDYSRLGSEKLDIFSQLDVRIDKKWNFKKFSFNLFVEAQNLLAQAIPQAPEFGLSRNNDGSIINPRSLVSLNNINDRVTPSIGVVIDF